MIAKLDGTKVTGVRRTPTASKTSEATTPAKGSRKLQSWISSFVEETANLEAPLLFRKWVAISTIAAALEQKVWMMSPTILHPNLYVMILGHPGTGKTRTIKVGRALYAGLVEPHLAPISLTWSSLVDCLATSKRILIRPGTDPLEYQSMYICADELGTFIHKYENEMTDGLSHFYDAGLYTQQRRTNDLKVKIPMGHLNLLTGSTPQNLTALMPEKAWGQGFTSRVIMVFSDERIVGDDFAPRENNNLGDLSADLSVINNLIGQFDITAGFRDAVNNWRALGEPPTPNHPRLLHYVTRRKAQLYKLAMVASVDRDNSLIITAADFNTALGWLIEAEDTMPSIFQAGAANADAQAMDEILHYCRINDTGHGVSEQRITHFARDRIPLHSIMRVIEIMERSGMIELRGTDRRTKMRYFGPPKSNEGMVLQ